MTTLAEAAKARQLLAETLTSDEGFQQSIKPVLISLHELATGTFNLKSEEEGLALKRFIHSHVKPLVDDCTPHGTSKNALPGALTLLEPAFSRFLFFATTYLAPLIELMTNSLLAAPVFNLKLPPYAAKMKGALEVIHQLAQGRSALTLLIDQCKSWSPESPGDSSSPDNLHLGWEDEIKRVHQLNCLLQVLEQLRSLDVRGRTFMS
jgi:DNA-directed RNA polymerase subunit K/omega